MRLGKRILRSDLGSRAICWLVQAYIRLVWATSPWTTDGLHVEPRLRADHKSFLVAFWHGRLLMMPKVWSGLSPFRMLISSHPDGRIIAGAIGYFGLGSIAGSTTGGGAGALLDMVRAIRAGDSIGITPDGPDGPAMRASVGSAALAFLAKVPIVPVTYATSRRVILGSWDRFHLPLPFSRGLFLIGEPIPPPAARDEAALEAWRRDLEQTLNALTAEADRRMGHAALAPGTAGRKAARAAAQQAARESG
jgi:lysophospholipid acyltransferase (LPLAT)-like uncharacterized protein